MKLTRRRFGKLTIVTIAMGSLGYFPSNALAAEEERPKLVIVGVEHGTVVRNGRANSTTDLDRDTTENYSTIAPSTTPVEAFQGLVFRRLDLKTGKTQTQTLKEPILSLGERLTGLTYLGDGTLIISITPDSASANGAEPTRLLILDKSSKTIAVSGLQSHQALDSLLLLKDASLIGLVTEKDGSAPAKIVDLDPKTGKISDRFDLPKGTRFSCLAESPDGKLYTSVFRANATTDLLEVKSAQKTVNVVAKLTVDGGPWYHGIQSLMFSPAGELLALANLEYRLPNSLYRVKVDTGVMTKLADLEASRATLEVFSG
jgi:hypothetical protein